MLEQTKEVFRLWHQVTGLTLSRRKFQKLIMPVKQRVKELLDEGSECRFSKTRGTCRQIRAVAAALWTFVRMHGVEPTNNAAERALRRAVLWRRKSFGTQSAAGSGGFCGFGELIVNPRPAPYRHPGGGLSTTAGTQAGSVAKIILERAGSLVVLS